VARIVVISGDKTSQKTVPIEGKLVTIGRSPASTIVIDDKAASRKHCLIKVDGATCTLVDLGSANGTLVNGAKVKDHALSNDDRIEIGKTILVFKE
jgi:pSer/pThr/pTyr-binding forkhead associated (FHA) protein